MSTLIINPEYQHLFKKEEWPFARFMALTGDVYRKVKNRQTLAFEYQGTQFFIKKHGSTSIHEILKNWLFLRKPIIGAQTEFEALNILSHLSIDTMQWVAFGQTSCMPLLQQSFLVTRALENMTPLEDLCHDWPTKPPAPAFRFALLDKVATMSRQLHAAHLYHRDLYLCKFLWQQNSLDRLYLIDLHRTSKHTWMENRWKIKDLAGLYFSSLLLGLKQRDYFRFLKQYYQQPLRDILKQHSPLLKKVVFRAQRLALKEYGYLP